MDIKRQTLTALQSAFNSIPKKDSQSNQSLRTISSDVSKSDKGFKLPEMSEDETTEATGSGSAGQYSAPLFSGEMKEKWSEKYKKSINCKNPKGFSQRAHCQGRKKKLKESLNEAVRSEMAQLKDLARKFAKDEKDLKENPLYYDDLEKVEKPKKEETKEATGASSAGQYSGPAFGAKSMSPKDWRGRAKTQIPGGAFVQVKKKCKTFPYCNQGDINALKLSRSPIVKKKAKKLAEQYGVTEELIMKIIIDDIRKNIKK